MRCSEQESGVRGNGAAVKMYVMLFFEFCNEKYAC